MYRGIFQAVVAGILKQRALYKWELRLQDEVALDFTIDEVNSNELRQKFELENPELVEELKQKEEKRRERKRKKDDPDNDFSLDIELETGNG